MSDPPTDQDAETPELADARQNPWYVLMTVADEQKKGASVQNYDKRLHAKNRRYFNGWMAAGLSEETKQKLIEDGRATAEDLAPLTEDDYTTIRDAWAARCAGQSLHSDQSWVKVVRSTLDRPLICIGFVFSGPAADFRDTTFSSGANFWDTTFSGSADFRGTTFSDGADFRNTTFWGPAEFKDTTFSWLADFMNTTFSGSAEFQDTTFSWLANFKDVTFSGIATFQGTTLSDDANFLGTTFSSDADFRDTTFSGSADFRDVTFSGIATFQGTTFSKDANFLGTTFYGRTYFEGTTFSNYANFLGTAFSDAVAFLGTTFSQAAYFQDATFSNTVAFQDANFAGYTTFHGAAFLGIPEFSNAVFKSSTSLSPVKRDGQPDRPTIFKLTPPRFFNAELHEDTDFTDVEWPPPPDSRDEAIEQRRAYERLKLLMSSQKKVADELFFQPKELMCREIEDGWFSLSSWGSRFFRITSNYGWSLNRPIWWLCVLVLACAAIIWGNEQAALVAGDRDVLCLDDAGNVKANCNPELEWDNALGLSFSNSFLFVGRTFIKEELIGLTLASEIVSTIQMILGPFLIFLFGLAVRNRFRLK
ncbi:MAG: pentapeptide repeat-containing protein [Pseudomonadota bacterium]